MVENTEKSINGDLMFKMGELSGQLTAVLGVLNDIRKAIADGAIKGAQNSSDIKVLQTEIISLKKRADSASKERKEINDTNEQQEREIVIMKKQYAWLMAGVGIVAGLVTNVTIEFLSTVLF